MLSTRSPSQNLDDAPIGELTNDPGEVLISVIIPTYNRGAAIEKTIESVLQQDLPPAQIEIIVINDGSTDETQELLQRGYASNSQVRLFSVPNGGVARARNLGLQHARGQYIAYLDHDDLWWAAKLRRQLEVAHENPDAAVIYCKWRDVDEQGIPLPATYWNTYFGEWVPQTGMVYD